MIKIKTVAFLIVLATFTISVAFATDSEKDSGMNCDMFNIEEILDESTLDIKILKDWHVDEVAGTTRQKLIEINVAEWWPGQEYRIPVRMIVPLKGKAKGFHITGGSPYESLMKDWKPNAFQPPGLTPSAFKMCRFGSFTANPTKWSTTWGRGMCLISSKS